jgi:hypothetical protein
MEAFSLRVGGKGWKGWMGGKGWAGGRASNEFVEADLQVRLEAS